MLPAKLEVTRRAAIARRYALSNMAKVSYADRGEKILRVVTYCCIFKGCEVSGGKRTQRTRKALQRAPALPATARTPR